MIIEGNAPLAAVTPRAARMSTWTFIDVVARLRPDVDFKRNPALPSNCTLNGASITIDNSLARGVVVPE